LALAAYLIKSEDDWLGVGRPQSCSASQITIATFSSLCITCVVAYFNNDDDAGGLKAGVIKRPLKLHCVTEKTSTFRTFFCVFNVFFQNPKNMTFYVFWVVAHVFLNTEYHSELSYQSAEIGPITLMRPYLQLHYIIFSHFRGWWRKRTLNLPRILRKVTYDAKCRTFWPPVKIRGGVGARFSRPIAKLYLRPNLQNAILMAIHCVASERGGLIKRKEVFVHCLWVPD